MRCLAYIPVLRSISANLKLNPATLECYPMYVTKCILTAKMYSLVLNHTIQLSTFYYYCYFDLLYLCVVFRYNNGQNIDFQRTLFLPFTQNTVS